MSNETTTLNNNHLPNGTIVWKMGRMWGFLSPNQSGAYYGENAHHTSMKPIGIEDTPSGKGSFKDSFQIIGNPPEHLDTTIRLGWANIHLSISNGHILTSITNATETVRNRWATGIRNKKPRSSPHSTPPYNQVRKQHHRRLKLPLDARSRNALTVKHNYQSTDISSQWDWLRSAIYLRDNGICWVCNKFVLLRDYDLGHLIDRCNGGNDAIDNCAVMHKRCNGGKPTHTTLEEATKWRLTHQFSYQEPTPLTITPKCKCKCK